MLRDLAKICEFGTEKDLIQFMRDAGLKPDSEEWKQALSIWKSGL
jgi:hypothetical protein